MNKKVSVVIPFFQRQPGLLRKAVISALGQKGDYRMEIVIVDDESPIPARTELADLLPQHSDKFIIVEQKNAGCFPAGNTGLNHVSSDSDYIAFLDSDDEWFEGHLEHAVWALDQGYDLYFSDFYQLNQTVTAFNRAKRIDVEKHPRIHSSKPIHEYRGDMVDQIIRGSILGTSTIVYNRKTFAETRYLENYKHTGPEYIFWIQLALRSKKIAFSSAPECQYGGGVNIFSESGWGTDKFLSVEGQNPPVQGSVRKGIFAQFIPQRRCQWTVAVESVQGRSDDIYDAVFCSRIRDEGEARCYARARCVPP